MVREYLVPFVFLLEEMAPYLLLGLLVAGILHAFVPRRLYQKWLSGNDLKSVLLSVLFGIPLPLCSCGVVPAAVAMYRQGASRSATTAFLISTPQTGVDSIAATWSVLGMPFAILRPLASLVTGVLGGLAVGRFGQTAPKDAPGPVPEPEPRSAPKGFWRRCLAALDYAFTDMLQDIGKWLLIGLLLAGLITIFVPDDFFTTFTGGAPMLNYLFVMAIAVPMYVCATGSIPIAAALVMKGLSPGAAFIFLMAGPATNIASMLILDKTLGRKSLVAYLASIILGAFAFGLLTDLLLPPEWFTDKVMGTVRAHCHVSGTRAVPWWHHVCAAMLIILLLRTLFLTHKHHDKLHNMQTFQVSGMVCNHCKANVERTLAALPGVSRVDVDLASGMVQVEGDVDARTVAEAVSEIGYDCKRC